MRDAWSVVPSAYGVPRIYVPGTPIHLMEFVFQPPTDPHFLALTSCKQGAFLVPSSSQLAAFRWLGDSPRDCTVSVTQVNTGPRGSNPGFAHPVHVRRSLTAALWTRVAAQPKSWSSLFIHSRVLLSALQEAADSASSPRRLAAVAHDALGKTRNIGHPRIRLLPGEHGSAKNSPPKRRGARSIKLLGPQLRSVNAPHQLDGKSLNERGRWYQEV